MKSVLGILLLPAMCILITCGGSGRNDPFAPGSGLGPGASMANATVTEANQYQACQAFNELIISSFAKGVELHATTIGPSQSLRFTGGANGSCTATMIDTSGGSGDAYASHMSVAYENYYSDSGKLYFNGELALTGRWSIDSRNEVYINTCFVTGTIVLSGEYACTVEFDRFSIMLRNGQLLNLPQAVSRGPTCTLAFDGTVKISSPDAQTIEFNPYEFDMEGCY